jgi:hypothetical protein
MADRRGDSWTAPKTARGLNHEQNRARTMNARAPARPEALDAKEVRRSALAHANAHRPVVNDERENIAVDLVRWVFRVLRYREQRPSDALDELDGGGFHRSVSR